MHFNDIINAVLNGLAEFRFQDFIDIVIITVIIYKIICWTINTRAYQLLKGLTVLLVVMLLSALFNLYTVNYLLNTLLVSGIVVMVVLFQPELRRALAHIGRFKFNLPGREVENSNVIVKEMTNAMINLSKRKVGALVVPLFSDPNVSKELGTRHRAALGVSNVSDSLTVVVSEETGVISYAEGGKLVRYVDKKTLAELLEGVFAAPEQEKTFASLFKRLTKDETKQKK